MGAGTIIYLGEFCLPDKNAAAHRVLNNAKAFRELGYEVVFIGTDEASVNKVDIQSTKKRIQGFDSWSVSYPTSKVKWLKYLTGVKDKIKIFDKYKDIKILICYNYPAISLLKLKVFCKKNKIKLITDVSEWHHSDSKGLLFRTIKNIDTFLRMRYANKRVDGLIVISSFLFNYYNNCKNIILVPPLVDADEEKWSSKQGTENKVITLVYSGSPGRSKDKIGMLLRFIYESREIHIRFIVVGISKKQYEELHPEEKEYLKDERIEFVDRVPHAEALKILKNADFTLFFREKSRVSNAGFPTKLVESLSCGIPVITNNTSDISKYIRNGENGFLLEETNFNSFREVFELQLNTLKNMKNNVQRKRFHYINYVEDFRKFLESIMEGRL